MLGLLILSLSGFRGDLWHLPLCACDYGFGGRGNGRLCGSDLPAFEKEYNVNVEAYRAEARIPRRFWMRGRAKRMDIDSIAGGAPATLVDRGLRKTRVTTGRDFDDRLLGPRLKSVSSTVNLPFTVSSLDC